MPSYICAAILVGTMTAATLPLANAEEQVSPQELNDCTALTNPGSLAQCIITAQGARKIRGKLTSPKAATPDVPSIRNPDPPLGASVPASGPP